MLTLDSIRQTYRSGDVETRALDGVSLRVDAGEFVAVMGPSGCGKSSLLNIMGLLDSPVGGSLRFRGEEVACASRSRLADLRRGAIGFVFQTFNLIEDLTVAENVEVGLLYTGVPSAERRRRVAEMLDRVAMGHRARHLPRQLSGGQQQRVAVARALVAHPVLILADEPTGNLDTANGEKVMDLLSASVDAGAALVMVTHSRGHAARARRIIHLLDGRVVSETVSGA